MSSIRPTSGMQDVMALRQEVLQRSKALQDVRSATETKGASNEAAPGIDFADTLGSALKNVSAIQQRSSDMQAAYERGEVTDIAQVMLARQESGVAFEATLQVRNKLLTAYQDIMRMGS
ncbi:MAG: flagellar hook-basal body complex protein FliE [Pseudomonadota bacterium]